MTLLLRPRIGRYGDYGGRYSSELLTPALSELELALTRVVPDAEFQSNLRRELEQWGGRPTPLTILPRLSKVCGLDIRAKREDLLHGGAHKTNNVIGQALLARALGKRRLIAETGAGQHGVATAMAAARYGLQAVIYMGRADMERQEPNVRRMRLCGAEVIPVDAGTATLKEAITEALRDWTSSLDTTHYLMGTVCGPHPYPQLVRELQAVIGREAREQVLEATGELPEALIACVGGGSNAIGLWHSFLADRVRLIGIEPGGEGLASGRHGATLVAGTPGLLHGARTYVLQDDDGQILPAESVAAGLDYPGVGPEHAALKDAGRAEYFIAEDGEALEAFSALSRLEGIIPALETAHAIAFLRHAVARGHLRPGARVVVNLSGRGDKDLARVGHAEDAS